MSFFEKLEVWKEEYLFLRYVFLNFNDYKNLGFNFPIGIILILLAIALPVAVFSINTRKNTVATVIKQLLRHGAVGEENAKGLKSLRLSKVKSLGRMLLSGGQFSSIVKIKGYVKPSYEEYIKDSKKKPTRLKLDEIEIYLEEQKLKEAETIASVGTSSILKPIIISAIIIIILAAIFIALPEILEFINSSIK